MAHYPNGTKAKDNNRIFLLIKLLLSDRRLVIRDWINKVISNCRSK
jgi:hypothetical protein